MVLDQEAEDFDGAVGNDLGQIEEELRQSQKGKAPMPRQNKMAKKQQQRQQVIQEERNQQHDLERGQDVRQARQSNKGQKPTAPLINQKRKENQQKQAPRQSRNAAPPRNDADSSESLESVEEDMM